MLTNEDIVRRYRKLNDSWKLNEKNRSWLNKLAEKAVLWKLPRWWNNMSNNVTSQAAEAFKKWFANQWTWWPITWIWGTALWTMVWWIVDAVNIPVQWYRNAYNAAADFYNAWASERSAINQAMTAEGNKWLLKEMADRVEAYQPEIVGDKRLNQ